MSDTYKLEEPTTRLEKILGTMSGDFTGELSEPVSKVEAYLVKLSSTWIKVMNAQFQFKKVEALPEVGEIGYIYLVAHTHSEKDVFDEYIWVPDDKTFEKIGNTDIDLSSYMKTEDSLQAKLGLYFDADGDLCQSEET